MVGLIRPTVKYKTSRDVITCFDCVSGPYQRFEHVSSYALVFFIVSRLCFLFLAPPNVVVLSCAKWRSVQIQISLEIKSTEASGDHSASVCLASDQKDREFPHRGL